MHAQTRSGVFPTESCSQPLLSGQNAAWLGRESHSLWLETIDDTMKFVLGIQAVLILVFSCSSRRDVANNIHFNLDQTSQPLGRPYGLRGSNSLRSDQPEPHSLASLVPVYATRMPPGLPAVKTIRHVPAPYPNTTEGVSILLFV